MIFFTINIYTMISKISSFPYKFYNALYNKFYEKLPKWLSISLTLIICYTLIVIIVILFELAVIWVIMIII